METFKPYLPPISGTPIPFLYYKPTQKFPETDTWVVDHIVNHRIRNGVHQWRVRWKGFDSSKDTWEPASQFIGNFQHDWLKYNEDHKIKINLKDLMSSVIQFTPTETIL